MGRWSRQIAPQFVDWLATASDLDWVEIGCGTGALSAQILKRVAPASLVAIDPSAGFIAKARAAVPDPRARFGVGTIPGPAHGKRRCRRLGLGA